MYWNSFTRISIFRRMPMQTNLDRGAVAAPLRIARFAVAAVFFLNGAGIANWVVRIPAVRTQLGLSDAALGFALLGVAVGALFSMPLTGRLVTRHGSRPITRAAAILFAASLVLPPLAPNLLGLTVALIALGAANGALDVAMNVQAATVERRYERPIMSGFHALFSLGGLVGAATGGILAELGVGPAAHLGGVAVLAALVSWGVSSRLLPARADATASSHPVFVRPSRTLLALGIVAFCVLLGEGAMADWSAVYLRDITGAGPGMAAAGYAAFSLAMAAGRSVGDRLTVRWGPVRLVRFGGAVAAAGLTVALAIAAPGAAVLGFAVVGAGLSIVFPSVLTAAGRLPGSAPGSAIAAVSSLGYFGFLAGPPFIGLVAEWVTLRGGLALVVLSCAFVALLSSTLRAEPVRREWLAASPTP